MGEAERITREIHKSLEKGEIDRHDAEELLVAFGTRRLVYAPPRRRRGRGGLRELPLDNSWRIRQALNRARLAGIKLGRPRKEERSLSLIPAPPSFPRIVSTVTP